MAEIKYFNRLNSFNTEDISKMELAAKLHRQHSNLRFKIVDYQKQKVIIQVVQEKSSTGIYHSQKRLIEIVHETFDRFFEGSKVLVHAIPFNDTPVNKVTTKWINKQLIGTNTKLKQIEKDTGIDLTTLKKIISGEIQLSQTIKAFFYYYFLQK